MKAKPSRTNVAPPKRRKVSMAEAFDAVADLENDMEDITSLAHAIGLCALAVDHVGHSERDAAAVIFLTQEIKARVKNLYDKRSLAWDALWPSRYGDGLGATAVQS
jgi:hypothetical protein